MTKETTKRIEITIEIDNQAFVDNLNYELNQAFTEIELKIQKALQDKRDIFIHDSNGNNVGFVKIIEEEL